MEFNRAGDLKSDLKLLSWIVSTARQKATLRSQMEQLGERDSDKDVDEEQRRAAADSFSSAFVPTVEPCLKKRAHSDSESSGFSSSSEVVSEESDAESH